MPIFEYRCTKCKEEFEELVLNSNEEISCPKCKSKKIEKKPSVFAHQSDEGFRSSAGSSCSACSSGTCSTCKS